MTFHVYKLPILFLLIAILLSGCSIVSKPAIENETLQTLANPSESINRSGTELDTALIGVWASNEGEEVIEFLPDGNGYRTIIGKTAEKFSWYTDMNDLCIITSGTKSVSSYVVRDDLGFFDDINWKKSTSYHFDIMDDGSPELVYTMSPKDIGRVLNGQWVLCDVNFDLHLFFNSYTGADSSGLYRGKTIDSTEFEYQISDVDHLSITFDDVEVRGEFKFSSDYNEFSLLDESTGKELNFVREMLCGPFYRFASERFLYEVQNEQCEIVHDSPTRLEDVYCYKTQHRAQETRYDENVIYGDWIIHPYNNVKISLGDGFRITPCEPTEYIDIRGSASQYNSIITLHYNDGRNEMYKAFYVENYDCVILNDTYVLSKNRLSEAEIRTILTYYSEITEHNAK